MTKNNKLDKEKAKLEKVHNFLTDCVNKMKNKQDKLMTKHNFGKDNNKFVMYPERNAFYLFNKDTQKVFFKAKIQIIGTYSEKSKTWRWAWSNRYVPYDLKQTALKIKKFGEANKVEILSKPKIKDENLGHIFTALGLELSKSKGYYIVPGTKTYPAIYLIFTQVQKVNLEYPDVVKQMKTDKRANHQLMRNKLKPPQAPKKKDTLKSKSSTKKKTTQVKKTTVEKKTTAVKKNKTSIKKPIKPSNPVTKTSKKVNKTTTKKTTSKKKTTLKPRAKKSKSQSNKSKSQSNKSKSQSNKSKSKSNKKIKLVRNPNDKILIPLTKVAKLKAPQMKNNQHENNQNNNDYLSNNRASNLSNTKTLSSSTNSNSKSKATALNSNNNNNQSQKITKLVVPVKKKFIKK